MTDRDAPAVVPTRSGGPDLLSGAVPAGVLSFLPWWLRLAYRLSAYVRGVLYELWLRPF